MSKVDEFYEDYLKKNPDKENSTQRLVYVASDEQHVLNGISNG